jgi:cellulose synthase/poly-beta-1,6-N-acetylglucosamine synthase-like glycosyltransferase
MDDTRRILDLYVEKYRCVSVVFNPTRGGVSKTLNIGIRHAHSPIIAFTGADCTVDESWLRELIQIMLKEQVDVVTGRMGSAPSESRWAKAEGKKWDDWIEWRVCKRASFLTGANMIITRTLLDEVGGFDETLMAKVDRDLGKRLTDSGRSIAFADKAIVYHDHPQRLKEYFKRGIWYTRGLCAFNRKHYGSWYGKESLWRMTEVIWFIVGLFLLLLPWIIGQWEYSTVIFTSVGVVLISVALRRDGRIFLDIIRRRKDLDSLIINIAFHSGERLGILTYWTMDRIRKSLRE